jgi:malate dehydrogenase (oxaloacetate-decarboxylating)
VQRIGPKDLILAPTTSANDTPLRYSVPIQSKDFPGANSTFTVSERIEFNLTGPVPAAYETINEQVGRAYKQYSSFQEALNKHIYLRNIQDKNETVFYKLLQTHLEEMMPIVYTPTVGDACEKFSDIYRSARGLFVPYTERENLEMLFQNATKSNVKVIVVTDGERVLGLGDQGIGGMGISVGKLSLYTVCGGISPAYTLPIVLDVDTNNKILLNDPMYMGLREKRIDENTYRDFLDAFMNAAHHRWPGVMIPFKDFAQGNAMPLLERYKNKACCFNDDIQGSAAVTLGSLLEVIGNAKPHVLIGVSGQANLFTEEVVKKLLENCRKPIISP